MIQRYRRKALLCLLNYKRATAEFCMCAHLDACMAVHTSRWCQRAIWCSWYDPVQRTVVFVKSALTDLDIHGKVGFSESWRQQSYKSSIPAQACLRLSSRYRVHQTLWHIDLHYTFQPVSTEFVQPRGSAAGIQQSLVFGRGLCARQQTWTISWNELS